MVSISAVRIRVQELLKYFAIEYVKAYKTALVLQLRDAKVGAPPKVGRPEFQLLIDNSRLPAPNPRIEGEVWVGDTMKEKQKWSMARNWLVTTTAIKEEKKKDDKAAAGAGGPEGSPASPSSPAAAGGRRDSSVPDSEDARIWLDDDATNTCMNPACGAEFSLFSTKRHCRLCGEIFCKKCRDFRIDKDNKFCEPCYTLRMSKDAPESQMPLLTKPEVRSKQLNFSQYKVDLSDADLFMAAGAQAAAEKAGKNHNGKFVLVLSHRRATRPQLKVGFDTIEQRDQWRALMQTASWASPSPITTDTLLRPAFLVSFRKLRWHAWVWSGWAIDGTEAELLTDILSEVLYREMVAGQISNELARKMAVKSIYRVLVGAVATCWSGIMKSLPGIRTPLEEIAGKMLDPLFEAEAKLKDKVMAPMEDAATKGMDKAEGKLQELFAEHLPIIFAAAESQVNMIHNSFADLITKMEEKPQASASDFDYEWGWMTWRGSWTWSYQQGAISNMLYAKLITDGSAPSRQLGYDLISDMKDLNQSAFVATRNAMNSQGGAAGAKTAAELVAALKAVYPSILSQAVHDVPLLLTWRMSLALDSAILPPLMEATNKIISTLCEPLTALIPELIQDIVDPVRTCGEIIQEVVVKQEQILVQRIMAPLTEQTVQQGKTLEQKGLVKV
jgi:hypothetical protein